MVKMKKEFINRFLNKDVEIIYWDRENKEELSYEGKLVDIENEFIVIDFGNGLARIFIGDLRLIEETKEEDDLLGF